MSSKTSQKRGYGSSEKLDDTLVKESEGYTLGTFIKIILVLFEGLGMTLFSIPPIINIFGSNGWRPRDWFIAFTFIYGIEWLMLTGIFIALYKSTNRELVTQLGTAIYGTYRRFNSFYVIRTLVTFTLFFMWWFWLAHNSAKIHAGDPEPTNYMRGNNKDETPECPAKNTDAYPSFNKLILTTIILYMALFTQMTMLAKDMFDTEASRISLEKVANPNANINSQLRRQNYDPKEGDVSQKAVSKNKGVYYVYNAANALLYLVGFVYFMIFYAQSFQNQIPMKLSALFFLMIIMLVMFLIKQVAYRLLPHNMKETFSSMRTGHLGVEVNSILSGETVFWTFVFLMDFLFYGYYFAQDDSKNIYQHVPRFQPNPISNPPLIQTNEWYAFQNQCIINGGNLIGWAVNLIPIIFTSTKSFETLSKSPKTASIKLEAKTGLGLKIMWLVVSWAAVIIVFSFSIYNLVGNSWLAIVFHAYAIAFFIFGGFLSLLAILYSRVRFKETVKGTVASSAAFTINTWRTIIGIPIYYIMNMIVLAVAWNKYPDLGHQEMSVLLQPPAAAPIEPITLFWWTIVAMQIRLMIPLCIILAESNGFIISSTYLKKTRDKKDSGEEEEDDEDDEGNRRQTKK